MQAQRTCIDSAASVALDGRQAQAQQLACKAPLALVAQLRVELAQAAALAEHDGGELPLLGLVAAGMPIEAAVTGETMAVPPDMLRKTGNHYVLKVRGNSMIDEQIRDGDFVVVNERKSADNGEMVIALLERTSATVKRYYREKDGRIRLQPANDAMEPIYTDERNLLIQGVVVGVLRRYS